MFRIGLLWKTLKVALLVWNLYYVLYGEVKDRAREAGPGFGLPGYRLHVYI
jgi:hypothetical protein